ncbi:hypothetical protein BD769DRAFT_1406092 [Suillus cothurnatus]|nr:hypothetical protein BD769DRAFT_1406092 [Suillus cothurnatus]
MTTSPAALRYFCRPVTTMLLLASASNSNIFSETVTQGLESTASQGHGGVVFPMDFFLVASVGLSEGPWLDATCERARQNCPVQSSLESSNPASMFCNEH